MSARNSLIVCIVLAAFAARPVQAASFMGGFKGGFNETTMTGFTEDVGWRNTFVVGAVGAWEVRPWFIVLAEPSFVGQGCDLDSIPNSGLQLTYFELPILAKFKKLFDPKTRSGLFGTVGPVMGINTQATLRLQGAEENATNQITDFDFGVGLGLGLDWDLASGGMFTVEGRFLGGLLDVTENGANPAIAQDVKNLSVQITVGWSRRFDL